MDIARRFSFPEPESPGNRLLSAATHLKLELYRVRGQLALEVELRSEIASLENATDDEGGVATLADAMLATDAEVLQLAGNLTSIFAALGKGGAA